MWYHSPQVLRRIVPGSAAAVLFALACVLAAAAVKTGFDLVFGSVVPFATFFPAALIATLVGGLWVGAFALVLGAAVAMALHAVAASGQGASEAANLALFLLSGSAVVAVSEAYRRSTARVKAGLDALQESEARFRTMADSAPALIWMSDEAGRLVFMSRRFEEMFGRPAHEVRRIWRNLVPAEDAEAFRAAFRSASERRAFFRSEVRVRTADGAERWLRCEGAPRFDGAGAFLGYTGCNVDITDAKRARQRQKLLLDELNHRVKNTLATVQSIVSNTLRHSPDPAAFMQRLEARLNAISATHDLLVQGSWESAPLADVVAAELRPYQASERVTVTGRPLMLNPHAAVTLGLITHELATNAAKYGALSNAEGRVRIAWREEGDALRLDWVETDGPAVKVPESTGFGTRLLARSVRSYGGSLSLDYAADGLHCTLRLPLKNIAADLSAPAAAAS